MAQDSLTIGMDPKTLMSTMIALESLKDIERDAVVKQGLSDGAGVIRRETAKNMSQRVAVRKGNLKKSLTKRRRTIKKEPRAYVGFSRPKGAIAHILDRGTKERYTKKTHAKRGRVTPRMFHTDAFEHKKEEALQVIAKSIQISIDKISSRRYK